MTSEILPGEIRPRPVVSRLPRYAAGKPPVAVDGLASYKLSSNENPLPLFRQC
ncbi:histidinol-Phosphate aminotransferase [Arthrobacter sp. Hiyo4]|nr:histidinol-Phosphate aminotransferase [Arthrobacter sp. Hiyo4]